MWKKKFTAVLLIGSCIAGSFCFTGCGQEDTFDAHIEAGRTYREEEAYEEAVDEFTEAIAVDANVVEPYYLLAQAYIGLDDTESVYETYDTARDLIVTTYDESDGETLLEDAGVLYEEAVAFYYEQDDVDEAEAADAEAAVRLSNDEYQALQAIREEYENALAEAEAEAAAAAQTAWAQSYADYLENEGAWDAYFYLIYLNDDDIPEIICGTSDTENPKGALLYIEDGQVKEVDMWYFADYVENSGYISWSYDFGGFHSEAAGYYLDDTGSLQTVCAYEIDWGHDPDWLTYTWDGEEYTQEEFDAKWDAEIRPIWVSVASAASEGADRMLFLSSDGFSTKAVPEHEGETNAFETYSSLMEYLNSVTAE
ncbi:MAG: tetratricopeptide repeat protein [Clostridiales bacterium]|nr:tetratricopeptide repeat protein [Clostridiales bacterium]